jgi:hypothetical protein
MEVRLHIISSSHSPPDLAEPCSLNIEFVNPHRHTVCETRLHLDRRKMREKGSSLGFAGGNSEPKLGTAELCIQVSRLAEATRHKAVELMIECVKLALSDVPIQPYSAQESFVPLKS